MKRNIHALEEPYRTALLRHLGNETAASLRPAQRLGRKALALGADTLDMARIHERALVSADETLSCASAADRNRVTRRGAAFFAEALLPLETKHRAAREANDRLSALRIEMSRRNRELKAANRKLDREIERRKAAQESFRKSEKQLETLLAQSRKLQDQLRFLSRRVLAAQEEERKRISRELHDVIAQMLTGIQIRLATLKAEALADARGLNRKISRTQRLVEKSVDRVHRFARELRPAVLDDLGLIPALHSFLKSFMQETGVQVKLTAHTGVEDLNGAKSTALYRVAQEALTNVARHAQASRADVRVRKLPHGVEMRISDNGKGFDIERMWNARKSQHLGMLGMRERADMVGGTFTVESVPGPGTTLRVQVPCGNGRRKS